MSLRDSSLCLVVLVESLDYFRLGKCGCLNATAITTKFMTPTVTPKIGNIFSESWYGAVLRTGTRCQTTESEDSKISQVAAKLNRV
jgi:hypothetical protein